MKILVCGGRDYTDSAMLFGYLDMTAEHHGDLIIVQGDCPTGADRLARMWATGRGHELRSYRADWNHHGKAAGPIRNQRMLDEERPDRVVAAPGGRGTADMVDRAHRAGVEVYTLPATPKGE
jgi:hypothetical protein